MPFSSITGWGFGKMNVLLILIAGLMLAGAETTLKSADFKPTNNNPMIEVFEAAKVELKSGSLLKIELPLSLGTGYQWELLGPNHGPLSFQQTKTYHLRSLDQGLERYNNLNSRLKPNQQVLLLRLCWFSICVDRLKGWVINFIRFALLWVNLKILK